ncbi:hypothetical protein NI17_010160 [Thermobifida halotolerans]|uniref:Cysteine-rich CPCC domain-containing protein n=1 Tax=Thermobifida halotolerans TaxID=483545 RepID=A0AA97M0L9_9ACTN|nr:hypothetical protein NI17_010160 [Thermobifida halotolerans]
MSAGEKFPCPCCGYKVYSEGPGSHEICPICLWEDDLVQLRWPCFVGGANGVSLVEAQKNFLEFGACKENLVKFTRKPVEYECTAFGWRPIDLDVDYFGENLDSLPYPRDKTLMYWWKEGFWLKGND